MNKCECRSISNKSGYGKIDFQYRIALNTGKEFEVGYVYIDGRKCLFCKRQSNTDETMFYLCNEFAELTCAISSE